MKELYCRLYTISYVSNKHLIDIAGKVNYIANYNGELIH